jgi:hypothetical protein
MGASVSTSSAEWLFLGWQATPKKGTYDPALLRDCAIERNLHAHAVGGFPQADSADGPAEENTSKRNPPIKHGGC